MPLKIFLVLSLLSPFALEAYQQPPLQPPPSPVDARILAAQTEVKRNPNSPGPLNDLAFALIRKGRDLRDGVIYMQASEALDQSLRMSAENYDARKLRVAVLLGLNEPSEALKLASQLNGKIPDDLAIWALLVDANVQLGNYAEAEHAAQWVLDLRPGSSLGFEKAAELRELFGDTEGALEFLDEANRRTSQNDSDQKAWLLTEKARLILAGGETKSAAILLTEALRLFPGSQLAEAGMAQVRIAEGNYPAALVLLEARYRRVPSLPNLYDWAEALANSGQSKAAAVQFDLFEKGARADTAQHQHATLQLISYYSDRKPDPAEALSLASSEVSGRHDAPSLAAYAWALYRDGRFSDAKVQMDKALAVGIRNPVYFCHAESISTMVKDSAAAQHYLTALSSFPGNACPSSASLQSANQVQR